MVKMTDINKTLSGREENYGSFRSQAHKSQMIKESMCVAGWDDLRPIQKEALEMIAHKIARILNGKGANYADNWHDIAGYATLVENDLNLTNNKESK